MAERTVSTRLILEGEKEYRAAIANINREYKTLDSALKLVESAFAGQQNTMAALEAKHKALTDVIGKQAEKLKAEQTALETANRLQGEYAGKVAQAKEKLDALNRSTDEAGKENQEYKDAAAKLQTEIAKYEAAENKAAAAVENHTTKANQAQIKLNSLNGELKNNEKYLQEAKSSADGCAKSIDEMGKEAKTTGEEAAEMGKRGKGGVEALAAALTAAGVVGALKEIAEALQACMDASVGFETAMAGVAKTTDMSEAELDAIGKAFQAMSTEMPVSAKELANIAEAAGQLGISKKDLVGFTAVMAKLGVATNMTSDEAATMLAQLAAVTGLDPQNYANLGSVIVALGNNFATNEKKITEMAQTFAGAGVNAGMSEQNILALSAAVTSLGIEAGTGGTNMSKLVGEMQIAVETGEGIEDWAKAAGMSVTEFTALWGEDAVAALGAFITGLGDTDESMLKTLGTLGITEERTTRMITSLANAEKKSGMLTKAVNLSNKAWKDNNALNKEAATRFQTTESKISMYQNSVENLKVVVGDQLTPALGQLTEAGTNLNIWAADFVSENEEIVPVVTAVVAALGTFSLTVAGVSAVILVAQKAMALLNGTLATNPWFLAAAAIAAVVAAIAAYALTSKDAVDELTQAAQAMPAAFAEADKAYADNLSSIEGTASKAEILIDRLRELEEKAATSGLDEAEWREWNSLLAILVDTVPELSGQINLQTGEIAGGTAALTANTLAWKTNAIEQAKTTALKSKYDAYAEAVAELYDNRIALNIATKEAAAADQKYTEALERVSAATGLSREQLLSTDDIMVKLALTMGLASDEYRPLIDEATRLAGESDAANQKVSDLTEAVAAGGEAVAENKAALDGYNEAMAEMDENASDAGASVSGLTEAQQRNVAQFDELQTKLAELSEAYKTYYEEALKNIEGVVSGFDEVTEAETQSINDSMKALDDQLAYLQSYSDNLLKLKELADANGIDLNANLVSKLSDGSTESAAILQGIVDDGGAKLKDLNDKIGTVEEGKKNFSEIVAEMRTDFTDQSSAIVKQMETMVKGFDQSDAAGKNAQATVNALNAALEAGISKTNEIVNRYKASIAGIGRLPTKISSHASGLEYVPYDNYGANLHEGEMVLTKLEAQAYRAEMYANYDYPVMEAARSQPMPAPVTVPPIDYDKLAASLKGSLDGMAVVLDNGAIVGMLMPGISEIMGDQVAAGRFGG